MTLLEQVDKYFYHQASQEEWSFNYVEESVNSLSNFELVSLLSGMLQKIKEEETN